MRRGRHLAALAGVVIIAGGTTATIAGTKGSSKDSRPPAPSVARAAGAAVAAAFVANRGQTDARVRYYAQGDRYAFYLTRDDVRLSFLGKRETRGVALALRFLGRNPAAAPEGARPAAGRVNYLRGSDPSAWRTGLRRYGDVVYRNLWRGIDLRLHQRAGTLQYEFLVRPGARPSDIRLAYAGARGLAVDASGALRIRTALGVLRDSAPVSYQRIAGARVPVRSGYVLGRDGRFAFAVGRYRADRALVIDPGVQFTTFLGGASDESGAGIVADAAGNTYVSGTTQSPDFPTTVGAFKRTGAAQNFADVFVTKLNAAGTALVYSTFLGGSNMEFGRGLAVDGSGSAYVTGQTKSSNFPTTGGAFSRALHIPPNCPRCATDNTDGFVTKLNAAGSALVYSTYLGGVEYDSPRGIAVDGSGNAYVDGETLSSDWPTTAGAFDRTYAGNYDMFVTKLNTGGTGLVYSTFLGGSQVDNGQRVAVDASGSAYAVGFTSSTDFPTTAGALDRTANGGFDVSVTKLNPAGSALVYSTYLGGAGPDTPGGLAVDPGGNAYVSGGSGSTDFPATPGALDTTFDGSDAFVTKLNPAGSAAVYSTAIGGTGGDAANGVALDAAGDAWLTGNTTSTDYPVSADAYDASFNGSTDVVISELNAAGSALLYSTYLGGSGSEVGIDVSRAANGVFVTGQTFGMDFPATVGAFDTVWNGDLSVFWGEAFVTKLALDRTTSTPTAPQPVPAAPALLSPANADTPSQPVTFDWGTVAGAASYTIQIDDSSSFTAPLVRQSSVTESMYATTGLATVTHVWRVRGVNLDGVAGAWSAVRSLTPQEAPPPATLSTMSTQPDTVVGGDQSTVTAVLSVGAPDGGAVVSLSSSNPAVVPVPATVTIPANGFAGTAFFTTSAVTASTTVTITGTYNGSTRTAALTVTPGGGAPPAASLQSAGVIPGSVTGGSGAQGSVALSGAAPATGAAVSLSSSDPGTASVPASVTVAGGASAASFAVATGTVSAATDVTITATYGGMTRTAVLTVLPPAPTTATLTVSASGRSGVSVGSSPAGIAVATGGSGSASFAVGTSITLSVSGGRDAIFSGDCSSGGKKTKTCTFTLGGAASVTANVQ